MFLISIVQKDMTIKPHHITFAPMTKAHEEARDATKRTSSFGYMIQKVEDQEIVHSRDPIFSQLGIIIEV